MSDIERVASNVKLLRLKMVASRTDILLVPLSILVYPHYIPYLTFVKRVVYVFGNSLRFGVSIIMTDAHR